MKKGTFMIGSLGDKRGEILSRVIEKQLKQSEGASLLKISVRQLQRLIKIYKMQGVKGCQSKQKGSKSNNAYSESLQATIKTIIYERYADFGPSFAVEKLLDCHQLAISKETLRKWMISWGLWKAKRQKKAVIHQLRERRSCFGELIQLDGSPHDWFEGRGEKCTLLVLIDDATSKLVGLRFEPAETTAGYFRMVRSYIERHGVPSAFYSDKYGVFRINSVDTKSGTGETQFGRVCRSLDIKLSCANSPQAKGRVERVNQTLQDRLVKEMRLQGVSDIKAANAFLPAYMEAHNKRFAVMPREATEGHRKLTENVEQLDYIFSLHSERKLTKNLELSYENTIYQVQTKTTGYRLRGAQVEICEDLEGLITLHYQGHILDYKCFKKTLRPAPIMDVKMLMDSLDKLPKIKYKPEANHPWKRGYIQPVPIEIMCSIG